MKPILYLTVGLPRSGKSTWARQSGLPVVCPDEIRLALHGQRFVASAEPTVWATAKLMVAALFGAGHYSVVLDACNTTALRRGEWQDERWQIVYQEFPADMAACIERARATGREDIIPTIERMAAQFEPLPVREGSGPSPLARSTVVQAKPHG